MATQRFCLIGLCALILSLICMASWYRKADTQTFNGCGPKSLYAVCSHLGMHVGEEQILRLMGDHADVSSLADLQEAAKHLGLKADGMNATVQDLQGSKTLAILHVEGFHFIAVVGYKPHGLVIVDPASPSYPEEQVISDANLRRIWDGRALVITR